MITRIRAQNFKSGDLAHDLGKLNLVVGPNGSGKSAITQALTLAVNGFVPGIPKTNEGIYTAFAMCGQTPPCFHSVAVKIGNVEFLRSFRSGRDGYSQILMVNKRKASAQIFNAEMGRAGVHAIGDLSSFVGASDRKQIDEIFSKYPPPPELAGIDRKLSKTRDDLNAKMRKMRELEGVLTHHRAARVKIELPDMPLSECTRLIEQKQKELADARREQETAKNETAVEAQAVSVGGDSFQPDDRAGSHNVGINGLLNPSDIDLRPIDVWIPRSAATSMIETIFEAVKKTGCGETCVALMVIKRELKKARKWGES